MKVSNLPYDLKPIKDGYSRVSVGTSAVMLPALLGSAVYVQVGIEGDGVRVRFDQNNPTVTEGTPLPSGTIAILSLSEAKHGRFISSGSATIHMEQLQL